MAMKAKTGAEQEDDAVLRAPNNPRLNPAMIGETTFEPPALVVPGQPRVIDPGDAHPLPLPEPDR